MLDFQRTVLPNGLRIVVAPLADNPAVTIGVIVEAGSDYESKDTNGLSHFLEHMVFNGTVRRPSSIDIAYELEGIGATYNAFTTNEYTWYYIKSGKDHFAKILDVASDIYLNQIFDPESIDRERGVVIEEMNAREDQPAQKAHENLDELIYGDQPAGWSILGRKELINKFKREDFIKYKKAHYMASATTVVVAGAVDPKETLKQIKAAFADTPEGQKKGKKKVRESQSKPELILEERKTDQTHLVFGFRAFNTYDERTYACDLLADILGAGFSSRLTQRIRVEMGAAYTVSAYFREYSDRGLMNIYVGTNKDRVEEVVRVVMEELARLKKELVSDRELKKTKDYEIGSMMLDLETSDSVAGYYGHQEIMKKELLKPTAVTKKIKAVKAEDIRGVAKDLFRNNNLNLSVVGPVEDKKSLRALLKID